MLGHDAAFILLILFVLLALGVSFLCSVAETVLLSITPGYIENLRKTKPQLASTIENLRLNNIDRSLASILTMNTIAHTVGAIEAGAQATVVFGSQWIGLFSAIITLLILFLSEIIPKTLGAIYWPKLTRFTVGYIRLLIFCLYPLVKISEGLTRKLMKGKDIHRFKRDEFFAMADLGDEEGKLDDYEYKVLKSLFNFRYLKATDVMTPRTVITALSETISIEEAQTQWKDISFSRCPLYKGSPENITGYALKSEVSLYQEKAADPLRKLRRNLLTILDSTKLPALMALLMKEKQQVALVVDEYGSLKGLVTLEDVLEKLIGMEIMDEQDKIENMREYALRKWESRVQNSNVKTP